MPFVAALPRYRLADTCRNRLQAVNSGRHLIQPLYRFRQPYCPIVPLVSACAMVGLAELSKVSTLAPLSPL